MGAEYAAAADALLQWGHADVVCKYLEAESNAKRADGIAGRYTSFRRGDCFTWLPDDVIASIQKAPQPWECLRATIRPSPWNARRDTTKFGGPMVSTPLAEDEASSRILEKSGENRSAVSRGWPSTTNCRARQWPGSAVSNTRPPARPIVLLPLALAFAFATMQPLAEIDDCGSRGFRQAFLAGSPMDPRVEIASITARRTRGSWA